MLCFQQLWRNGTSLADENAASGTRSYLLRLNSLLDEETRSAAPYPCLIYTASTQLYILITKLALSAQNAGIVGAAARFFNILIDGEAEGILDNQLFARALIDLVRETSGPSAVRRDEEGDLVELLFGVANKIRLDPGILPAWFYADRAEPRDDTSGKQPFYGAAQQKAFPLFYSLVEYVYHDGRTGDFARTGLLYLTETASKSQRLEKWMIESDLATLMASGLGALYSRLSRRLPTLTNEDDVAPILALSDHAPPMKHSESSDFLGNMDTFLSFLLFWQDTLDHCGSQEVSDTLLDHFQILFLEQLLYPSLLESTDVDGGSTASVLTYLVQILESLDHPGMIQRILDYLLATPGQRPKLVKTPKKNPRMSLSRRKSLDFLNAMAEADDNPSPDLFNLVDLISMSLKSKNTRTAAATLRLITVILRRHHNFAFHSLFKVTDVPDSWSRRRVGVLDEAVRDLFDFASTIHENDDVDQTYSEFLLDVATLLECHNCYRASQASHQWLTEESEQHDQSLVVLVPDEFLMRHLVELLAKFFANDVITNLALTETIVSLASCSRLGLDNWLLGGIRNENDTESVRTPIFSTLMTLMKQIQQWQEQFPEWETLIVQQRARLMGQADADSLSTAHGPPIPASDSTRLPVHTKNRSIDIGSKMLDAYSDSVSPRGRSVPQKRHEGLESSPVAQISTPRTYYGSPLRKSETLLASKESSPSQESPLSVPDQLRKQVVLEGKPRNGLPANPIERLRGGLDSSPSPSSGTITPQEEEEEVLPKSVSLSHVLTNAIVLQQFLLEIAAIMQTRATMFEEVRFD